MDDLLKTLLFDAVVKRRPIAFDAERGEFTLGLSTFPADTVVNIKSIDAMVKGKPYTLFQLYYFLLHYDKPVDKYILKAKEDNVRFVNYLHREKIVGELFPGVTKFNPSCLIESVVVDAPVGIDDEPLPKKQCRQITEDEKEKWCEFLKTFDMPLVGSSEITSYWHATKGPPKLPVEFKDIIEADNDSTQSLDKLQKALVTRHQAMCVPIGPRSTSTNFFADVLQVITEVRQKERKGFVPSKQQRQAKSAPSVTILQNRRTLQRADIKATPMHGVPLSVAPARRKKVHPIIIVPNTPSALISMFNIKDFLEQGKWVSPAQKKIQIAKENGGKCARESSIMISPTAGQLVKKEELDAMGGSKWTVFRVIDTPEKLKAHEWDYVCSVFVLGTSWQFKNWFSENPVELCNKVAAFHLSYAEDRPHEQTSKWAVKHLKVSKNQSNRHFDRKVAKEFWQQTYRFLRHSPVFREL